jgi:hypothetical protein
MSEELALEEAKDVLRLYQEYKAARTAGAKALAWDRYADAAALYGDVMARALLSSPRVEDVRREALEEAAKVATNAIDSMKARQARRPGVEISALLLVADRIYQGIRSLSPPDGDGKQARPSGSAPISTGN